MRRLSAVGCALVLCVAALAQSALIPSASPIVWGPALTGLTPNSVRISYKTAEPATVVAVVDGKVHSAGTTAGVFHAVEVRGLTAGAAHRYYFVIETAGGTTSTTEFTFSTPAENLDTFTFVVYGDTRSNPGDHQSVVDAILPLKPVLAINTGDLIANGRKEDDWQQLFPIVTPLSSTAPYYPCLGNHEGNSDYYYNFFDLPPGGGQGGREWYSFSYGDAFFVSLNGCRNWPEQARWLDEQLTAAEGTFKWLFVFFHQPPFSSGSHGSDPNTLEHFVPIVEKHAATMVFSGHDHIYERSEKDGITYIVAGGGGAPRYQLTPAKNPYSKTGASSLHYCEVALAGNTLHMRVLTPDGKLLDEITLQARP